MAKYATCPNHFGDFEYGHTKNAMLNDGTVSQNQPLAKVGCGDHPARSVKPDQPVPKINAASFGRANEPSIFKRAASVDAMPMAAKNTPHAMPTQR